MSGLVQDSTLLAIMAIGALVIVVLWQAGLPELLVMWFFIWMGVVLAYRILQVFGPVERR